MTTQQQSGSAANNNGDNKYTTSITTSNDNANNVLNPHALPFTDLPTLLADLCVFGSNNDNDNTTPNTNSNVFLDPSAASSFNGLFGGTASTTTTAMQQRHHHHSKNNPNNNNNNSSDTASLLAATISAFSPKISTKSSNMNLPLLGPSSPRSAESSSPPNHAISLLGSNHHQLAAAAVVKINDVDCKQQQEKTKLLPLNALPFPDAFVKYDGDEGILSETIALPFAGNGPPSKLGRAPSRTPTPFASRIDVVVTYFASGFLFGHGGTTFQSVLSKCSLGTGDEYKVGSGFQNASQQPSPGYRKPHRLFEVGERAAPKVLGYLRCIIQVYRRLVYLQLSSSDATARDALVKIKGRPVPFAMFLHIINSNAETAILPAETLALADARQTHHLSESDRHVIRILQALADIKFTYMPPLATKVVDSSSSGAAAALAASNNHQQASAASSPAGLLAHHPHHLRQQQNMSSPAHSAESFIETIAAANGGEKKSGSPTTPSASSAPRAPPPLQHHQPRQPIRPPPPPKKEIAAAASTTPRTMSRFSFARPQKSNAIVVTDDWLAGSCSDFSSEEENDEPTPTAMMSRMPLVDTPPYAHFAAKKGTGMSSTPSSANKVPLEVSSSINNNMLSGTPPPPASAHDIFTPPGAFLPNDLF